MGKRRNGNDGDDEDNGFAQWGGYMEAKKAKLQQQFDRQAKHNTDKQSDVLKGIAIFVNGHTKPSAEELKVTMAEHGGIYHTYQTSATTHIIAANLPNVKIKKLGSVPIVKPGWIVDSVTLGRLLDYSNYLLYTNQSRQQPQLKHYLNEPTKTASDPKFLSEFYSNSRLHLIATLGAEMKQLVNEMREKRDFKFPALENLIETNKIETPLHGPIIMHIDMDCFFVSVGLRTRPELRGLPIAVTHSKGNNPVKSVDRTIEIEMFRERYGGTSARLDAIDNNSSLSEIASCSYEARSCGISNGMFMGQALKLCPNLKAIPYDFQGYREVSAILYETIASYTLDIEAVSCDEMYVDVTDILSKTRMTVYEWADHVRGEITKKTDCPCSTGFGGNRLQARLATKRAKPAGRFYLESHDVEEYISAVKLADLPGVGRATLAKLRNLNLETCGDVQQISLALLRSELGTKAAETVADQSRGIDRRPLQYEHERKSVSAEVNYGIRFRAESEAVAFLDGLSVEVRNRLVETGLRTRCVTLKVMVRAENAPTETAKFLGHGVCDSLSRSSTLTSATEDAAVIFKETKSLYDKLNVPFADLRGVGIQLSRLEKMAEMSGVMKSFLNSKSTKQLNNKDEPKLLPLPVVVETKSGRGRPKGSKNVGRKVSKPSGDLSSFFKSTKDVVHEKKTIKKVDIDFEVLRELPEDIRNEVIKEYQLETNPTNTSSDNPTSKSTFDTNSMPRSTTDPILASKSDKVKTPKLVETKEGRSFDSLSREGFKVMLKNWFRTQLEPRPVDVEMLAVHFKKLALERRIEQLHVVIKFLHRHISDKDCRWHDAYFEIVNALQEGMLVTYEHTLMVPRSFSCTKHA